MVYQFDDYRDAQEPSLLDRMAPPQSVEAEQAVLGGILIDQHGLDRVTSILTPSMFYLVAHQHIFKACLDLQAADRPVDLMTVAQRLEDQNQLDKVGGKGRLIELFETSISAVNIDAHAELIASKYKRRLLIQASQEIMRLAHDPTQQWSAIIQTAEDKIFSLSDCAEDVGLRTLGDILTEEMARITRAAKGEETPGYLTGFYDFDAITKGLKPHGLYIVAGRPGMGKTAYAAAMARNVASQGHPVAIFSLEMSGGEVGQRLIAAESSVHANRLQSGEVRDDEWDKIGESLCNLSTLPVFIDESQSITPSKILSQCRLMKARTGYIGMIVIDYLHLMLDGTDDEVREIGRITRACKKMARALNTPVVLLSQLNRANEARGDKRPSLADLRGSGSIEQDADLVAFLYREEYYNPDTPDRGIAEVIIAKQRNGAIGTVKLLFEPQYSRFKNMASSRPTAQYPSTPRPTPQNPPQQPTSPSSHAVPERSEVLTGVAGASSGNSDDEVWEEVPWE